MSLIIILVVIGLLYWLWPRISRYLRRKAIEYMARRTEDMFRKMAGMPPRDEQPKSKRKSAASSRSSSSSRGGSQRPRRRYRPAALMQLVAVDVTYTEYREFRSTTIAPDGTTVEFRYEEQVTDVKFTEYKHPRA